MLSGKRSLHVDSGERRGSGKELDSPKHLPGLASSPFTEGYKQDHERDLPTRIDLSLACAHHPSLKESPTRALPSFFPSTVSAHLVLPPWRTPAHSPLGHPPRGIFIFFEIWALCVFPWVCVGEGRAGEEGRPNQAPRAQGDVVGAYKPK